MESLADFLGLRPPTPERDESGPESTISAKDFARAVLHSPEYRRSLLDRIVLGELPSAIEALLWAYAYGKPVERVEVKDTTDDIDEMDLEQCEQEAQRLLQIARSLRDPAAPLH
jgi:hypothetical protein